MNSILEIYAIKPLFLKRGKRELRKNVANLSTYTYHTYQVRYVKSVPSDER